MGMSKPKVKKAKPIREGIVLRGLFPIREMTAKEKRLAKINEDFFRKYL
jgi:hypothetical protein